MPKTAMKAIIKMEKKERRLALLLSTGQRMAKPFAFDNTLKAHENRGFQRLNRYARPASNGVLLESWRARSNVHQCPGSSFFF